MALSGKIAEAFVDVKANTKNYEAGVKRVKGSLGGLSGMAKSAGALLVGLGVVRGIKAAASAYAEQERAVAKLGAVLKSTGNASGFTASEMAKQAQELQNITTFSNDAIMNSQALLATFVEIKGQNFKGATKMVLEMSAAFSQDLKSSAIQLGKALNDPIKGMGALSRVGVSFSKAQEDMIKGMVRMGQTAKAQTLMLKIMKEQGLDGVAEAMRKTLPGAIDGMKNDFGDLSKAIIGAFAGMGMTDAVNNFSEKIRSITAKIKELTEDHTLALWVTNMKYMFKDLGAALMAPFTVVGTAIGTFVADAATKIEWMMKKIKGETTQTYEEMMATLPGVGATMEKLKEDIKKASADRKEAHKAEVAAILAGEGAVNDALKKQGEAAAAVNKELKKRTTFMASEALLKAIQAAADIGAAGAAGGVAGVAGGIGGGQARAAMGGAVSTTAKLLSDILAEMKMSNATLSKISVSAESFAVFA